MREIKFRAWDTEHREMILHKEDNCLMIPCSIGVLWLDPTIEENRYVIQTKRFILMQYTGLKDKNGIPIYEGDIVAAIHDFKNLVVTWCDDVCSFNLTDTGDSKNWAYSEGLFNTERPEDMGHNHWEVLGNIYENKELLNEKETL